MATVNPREVGERWNFCVRARVTPAITAVSNPKRRPPREAVIVLSTTVLLSGTFAAAPGSITTLARSTKGLTSEICHKLGDTQLIKEQKGVEERYYPFLRTPMGRMRALQT
jgi:hypothetical protein